MPIAGGSDAAAELAPRARAPDALTARPMRHLPAEPPAVLPSRPVAARAARVLRPPLDRAAVRRHALPLPREHPPGRRGRALSAAARGADARRGARARSAPTSPRSARSPTRTPRCRRQPGRAGAGGAGLRARAAGERAAAGAARRARRATAGGGDAVEVLYTGRDPFAQKLFVDKGADAGITPGEAVIDADGVVGPGDARVPAHGGGDARHRQGPRGAGARSSAAACASVLFGAGAGRPPELRFMAPNADIEVGDMLVTSGIDGTYPPGLAVAQVATLERDTGQMFARITARPLAGVDRSRHPAGAGPGRGAAAAAGGAGRGRGRASKAGTRQGAAAADDGAAARAAALRRPGRRRSCGRRARGSSCSRSCSGSLGNLLPLAGRRRWRCARLPRAACCSTGASRSRATSAWASRGSLGLADGRRRRDAVRPARARVRGARVRRRVLPPPRAALPAVAAGARRSPCCWRSCAALVLLVRFVGGAPLPRWTYAVPPLVGALLWPLVSVAAAVAAAAGRARRRSSDARHGPR